MAAIRDRVLAFDSKIDVRIVRFEDVFGDLVLDFRPNVILTFPLTSIGTADLLYVFKWYCGAAVVSLRAEGVVNPDSPSNIADHVGYDEYGPELVDWEVFWGPGMANIVGAILVERRKLSSSQRLRYFGYPRLERYFMQNEEKCLNDVTHLVSEAIRASGREQSVLVATGFHFANYTRDELYAAKDLDAASREAELLAMIEASKVFRQTWIDGLRRAANEHPEVQFILKKHPSEKTNDYASLQGLPNLLYVSQDVDIADLMERASLFLHYGSTTLADAYLAGVPSVYLYSDDERCRRVYNDMGWPSTESRRVVDIPLVINDFLSGGIQFRKTPEVSALLEYHFNIQEGRPYQPSREIAELLLMPGKPQKPSPSDRYFRRAIARHLYLRARRAIGRLIRRLLRRARGKSAL